MIRSCPIKLKFGDLPDSMFSAKELRSGIRIEKEHTNIDCVAKQIAKAHLREDPNYYTKLIKKNL